MAFPDCILSRRNFCKAPSCFVIRAMLLRGHTKRIEHAYIGSPRPFVESSRLDSGNAPFISEQCLRKGRVNRRSCGIDEPACGRNTFWPHSTHGRSSFEDATFLITAWQILRISHTLIPDTIQQQWDYQKSYVTFFMFFFIYSSSIHVCLCVVPKLTSDTETM